VNLAIGFVVFSCCTSFGFQLAKLTEAGRINIIAINKTTHLPTQSPPSTLENYYTKIIPIIGKYF
jgi:hypothetical protein